MKNISLRDILTKSWDIVLNDWLYLVGVSVFLAVALFVLRTIFSFIFEYLVEDSFASIATGIIFLVGQLLLLIYSLECILLASIYAVEKKRKSVFDTLSDGLSKFRIFFITLMLFIGTSLISLALFIFPFFLYFPTAYLSLVVVLRENREPYNTLLRSRRLTKPFYRQSSLLALLALFVVILLQVPVLGWLVGIFFALPFIANAFVLMYDELKKHYLYE